MTCTPEISRHHQKTCGREGGVRRTSSSNLRAWSILRGNPSMRKRPLPSPHPSPDLDARTASLADVRPDKVAELRVWAVLLSAQEVASGEVREVVLLDQKAALRSFS